METFETSAGDVKIAASKSGAQLVVWLPGEDHPRRFNSISATTPERIRSWLRQNGINTEDPAVEALTTEVSDYCKRYRQEMFVYDDTWPDAEVSSSYSASREPIRNTIKLTSESLDVVLLRYAYDAIVEACKVPGERANKEQVGLELSAVVQTLRNIISSFRDEDFFNEPQDSDS